jgi:Zn finger protein HypA/HybF involved in hydrogenase expression
VAISKNNPAVRDSQRLFVYCPDCEDKDGNLTVAMSIVKRLPGGMMYICPKCGKAHSITKGSYKNLPHEWKNKK